MEWRAQEYEAKISSGKIYELAEVVRDLNKGDDLMIDQSYSEGNYLKKHTIIVQFSNSFEYIFRRYSEKNWQSFKRNLEIQKSKIEKKLGTETKIETNQINDEAVSEQQG